MSLEELAVDLTCDASSFTPTFSSSSSSTSPPKSYSVHSGMLLLAQKMGASSTPLHAVLQKALEENAGYGLVLVGHSLGAGVAVMLGLLWTDLDSRKTTRESGLPEGRAVTVWAFACP